MSGVLGAELHIERLADSIVSGCHKKNLFKANLIFIIFPSEVVNGDREDFHASPGRLAASAQRLGGCRKLPGAEDIKLQFEQADKRRIG